jgi:hypothetical protein
MRALVLALAVAACGQSAAPPAPEAEVATTSGLDLSGHLIAIGPEFRFDALPVQNIAVLVYPAYEQTVSEPYVAPEATDSGAVLQSGDITLTLTPGACTHDGATFPMRASITITNGRPAEGCALIAWDHHLLELIPQIDACIAQAPTQNWVSYAGRDGEDVTVRLRGNGPALHCVVRGGVATVTPAEGEGKIAGDGEALFVRGSGGPNPGGECTEAPEVRSTSGEMLGWMMDPLGC